LKKHTYEGAANTSPSPIGLVLGPEGPALGHRQDATETNNAKDT